MLLLSFCDIDSVTWLGLWWLLPFLLGILLGWVIWSSYKTKFEESEEMRFQQSRNEIELTQQLEKCREKVIQLENDTRLLKTQVSEAKPILTKSKTLASVLAQGKTKMADSSENIPSSIYDSLDPDNLQIIEGIGPKMERVLKENGVENWTALGQMSFQDLRALLDKYGTKYQIIDPSTWAEQASLADQRSWSELVSSQKNMSSGQDSSRKPQAKVEKALLKLGLIKKWVKDDLKAIEGIGLKIESILKQSGIYSWQQLADADVNSLEDILKSAGDRYQLADPGTWPAQAKLAVDEDWSGLEAYQNFLKGGKEPRS
jgi:predicted flap endonuclease-1-like 5' DNA nuclease